MRDEFEEKVVFPEPGRYIVAVSGGVDSSVLLDVLSGSKDYELIVTHVDHGIRPESYEDEEFVHDLAARYGCEFHSLRLGLGSNTGETRARYMRYRVLDELRREVSAAAIITAHHLDDRVETMLLNRQRGAGWLGMAPLQQTRFIKRPLLSLSKHSIYEYAREHNVQWREDRTNPDPDYTERNRIRSQLDERERQRLYKELAGHDRQRLEREQRLAPWVRKSVKVASGQELVIDRTQLLLADVETARDVLYKLLREYFFAHLEIDFDAIVRLEHFYKTARQGKHLQLSASLWAHIEQDDMVLRIAG